MSKSFRPWTVDQGWQLPPSLHEFVPADHLAHFVRDTVREALDLSAILATDTEPRGYRPYHPAMMVALLLYGYSRGVYSSRQLARACEERVDFMAVTGLRRPDFRTISDFRKRHLEALAEGDELRAHAPARAGTGGRGGAVAGAPPRRQSRPGGGGRRPAQRRRGWPRPLQRHAGARSAEAGAGWRAAGQGATQLHRSREVSADAGFCAEANLQALNERRIRADIAVGRARHAPGTPTTERRLANSPLTRAMVGTLARAGRRSRYRLRKQVVEPVFGQIKQARGFRQILLRGLKNVRAEWALLCTVHNLLKLANATA